MTGGSGHPERGCRLRLRRVVPGEDLAYLLELAGRARCMPQSRGQRRWRRERQVQPRSIDVRALACRPSIAARPRNRHRAVIG
jgi:hypothetical protein